MKREKNKNIIYLKKRGSEHKSYLIASGVFAFLGIACVLYCVGIAIAGYGTFFFLIWGCIGVGCLGLSLMLRNRKLMDSLPTWLKRVCCTIFFLGLLLFCIVEGMIFAQYEAKAKPGADFCIILGAQWRATGPSEVLRRRLEKAIEYLTANPETKVIVSGGQGGNEPMAEAVGMYGYLVQSGIEEERILMEDVSANTFENVTFSGNYLDKENDRVVIVTNNFHVFRAVAIARKQGYAHAEGLAAGSVAGMAPNNLLREFLGVVKDFLVGNL